MTQRWDWIGVVALLLAASTALAQRSVRIAAARDSKQRDGQLDCGRGGAAGGA